MNAPADTRTSVLQESDEQNAAAFMRKLGELTVDAKGVKLKYLDLMNALECLRLIGRDLSQGNRP